ncbi:amidohydrolase [bacterium]|nr:amidohydrolase [bacterium]
MKRKKTIQRRATLKGLGSAGILSLLGSGKAQGQEKPSPAPSRSSGSQDAREQIFKRVTETPFIDTHEHLMEEKGRINGHSVSWIKSDDWSLVLEHYLDSDLLTAGMPQKVYDRFFSPDVDPSDKWKILEPYWWAVKNTAYGQAVCIAMKELYGVDELSAKTVAKVQAGYEKTVRPGFYRHILCELANIESCQVNSLEGTPFMRTAMPTLLMQDISIVGMFAGPDFRQFGEPAGIRASSLSDWHRVIDWWFDTYGTYAVAVKSQNAYSRDIDYEKVPADRAEPLFRKKLEKQPMTAAETKALEDHLFWYAVEKATKTGLPVKLHTGYYAGQNTMPLSRLINNPGSATNLCLAAPKTRFVFMHICYPYYEEMISIAKQHTNAYLDMCWAWIVNPVASKDFLKKYLVTAPANKILTFGGDYVPVEPVLGHAVIARKGIALALAELVEEGWMSLDDALGLVEPIMNGNARRIFNLAEKEKALKTVKWG